MDHAFVCHRGSCYGFDGIRLTCIDQQSGERCWKGQRYDSQILLLPAMDALLVLSEKGEVVLLDATSEGHKPIACFQALEGKTWIHPVIAHGRLFVRNAREAAAYQLSG